MNHGGGHEHDRDPRCDVEPEVVGVAITANQTQAGQSSQTAFSQSGRTKNASVTPTISASAACRLGIAA